ncbi:MAG: ketoacyl-ACP synthase III [Paludibacteraceae bacterium]|nr:ketoacyl-ACP synthase III [Paludibacteraceae bacterium]
MAFLDIKNVRIAGMAAGVPKNIASNLHPGPEDNVSADYAPEDFVATTGVEERRISTTLCASDLCYGAAEKLIADLGWDKLEIEGILFVSQTPDYILPATACILQDRLGLSTECYATDMSIGCSGWLYGLSSLAALVSNGGIKKALLMVGDAKARVNGKRNPLFGSSGTVTALEYVEGAKGLQFHFGTDGSGFDAIITPDGGARNQITPESFNKYEFEGKMVHRLQSRMKGMDVFSFGITTAPKSIKKLAEHFGFDYQSADYLVLHQANMKMNDFIVKKLKFDKTKVPSSLRYFANTNGASIPVTIVTQLKGKLNETAKFLCCGFGVGLSWGSLYFESDKDMVISDLVEMDDSETSTYVV